MNAHLFTFLEFELNLRSELLKKSGVRVPLASQPLKLLALLVRRAGDLVTREEIQQELWTKGAVVDFEHVVNQYIRQLRAVLGDSRESPTFIETAPRRGYRFVAPVKVVMDAIVPTLSGHPASAAVEAPTDLTALVEVTAPNGGDACCSGCTLRGRRYRGGRSSIHRGDVGSNAWGKRPTEVPHDLYGRSCDPGGRGGDCCGSQRVTGRYARAIP
jgi:DNA-binding winged helix-turn-helix (wHTH) protein